MNTNRRFQRTLALFITTFLAALPTAEAVTVSLTPMADTSLFQDRPNNNFGRSWLVAGTINTGGRSRTLVKFDLASIPANATITSAAVTFRISKSPSGAASSTFNLHRMLLPWTEGTKGSAALRDLGATAAAGEPSWNFRVASTAAWSAAGAAAPADFVATASASKAISSTLAFTSTAGLVADLQAWLGTPTSNHGWILITQAEATRKTARRFFGRETASSAPTLVVEYSVVTVTPPSITQGPQGQTVIAGSNVSFQATVTGTEPLSFQWNHNDAPLGGAVSAKLDLNNVQAANEGRYTVTVSNSAGSATSSAAVLALVKAPVISQPSLVGGSIQFSFTPQAFRAYTVEFANQLPDWQTLQAVPSSATPVSVTITDTVSGGHRFYRVRTP